MKRFLFVVVVLFTTSVARADEGMWLLSLLNKNIGTMQEKGCKITAEDIYSVNQACLKDAVVGLCNTGRPFRHFCTGEIISPKGLVMTNHHCAFSMIQAHSTVEHDYLSNGFWAYRLQEELANPGVSASILQYMEDVTDRVKAVLNADMSEAERGEAIRKITQVIVREAVGGEKLHAQVQSMFEGNQFFLLVYKIYNDVRLVGAPPQSLGKFGGDTDNWSWPRHTGDFSLLRIYTGPDGEPASFSEKNIPLVPKHHFPVSAKGVQDGDFAMTMGFPGSTDRFLTSFGLDETMEVTNAIRYEVRTEILRIMKEGMDANAETRIKYASKYAQCANYWKYSYEQNIALRNLNTMGRKLETEKAFTDWVHQCADRRSVYGEALPLIRKGYEAMRPYSIRLSYIAEALAAPEAHRFAYELKPLLESLCDNGDDSEKRGALEVLLNGAIEKFYKDYDKEVDKNMFAHLFKMYYEQVEAIAHPKIFQLIRKKFKGNFRKFAQEMADKSIFMSREALEKFMAKPDKKQLENDLCYLAGKSFRSVYEQTSMQTGEMRESIAKGRRLFVDGLMRMAPDKVWAPDANSTIRLSYGSVGSYRPKDGVIYDYYTTLTGVMEKEGPAGGEFEVPLQLKQLYAAQNFAPYGSDNVVTCFITNNDITGGNSGSPVINGNGELIGAAFDGNSEAMSGDIDFEHNLQRCINVDTRYVLFVIDKLAGAKNLIEEMTIVY